MTYAIGDVFRTVHEGSFNARWAQGVPLRPR
jgi:hypothetical protein